MSPATDSAQAKLHQAADTIANHPVVQQGSQVVGRQMNILDREVSFPSALLFMYHPWFWDSVGGVREKLNI